MKKTFVVTIDVDDEKVKGGDGNILHDLGITDERGHEIAYRCIEDMKAAKDREDATFNSLEACLKMLDEDKLTGNELLLLIHNGYCSAINLQRAIMSASPFEGM